MKQRASFHRRGGSLLIAVAALAALVSVLFGYHRIFSVVEAQARRQPRNIKPQANAVNNNAAASSIFNHEDHGPPRAKSVCPDCHIMATPQASNAAAPATKLSVRKSYPYHDSCIECHRTRQPSLFSGARPVICAVCHSRSSPRLTRDELNPFPKQSKEIKFNHESTSHPRECMPCHLNIGRMETPILTCADGGNNCHRKSAKPSIEAEMLAEDEDIGEGRDNDPRSREGKNTCAGCHTPLIGSRPPPCSHYCLFGDIYFKLADYPKSAKQLSEQCKCKK